MDQQEDRQAELEKLLNTAEQLETQRAILGDEVVDTALKSIQAQIEALRGEMAPGDAAPTQEVGSSEDAGGDKVGGDKVAGPKVGRDMAGRDLIRATRVQAHIAHIYQGGPGRPELEEGAFSEALDRYLEWVVKQYGRLDLRGVEKREQQVLSLDLDEVYVSLEADVALERKEERRKGGGAA